MLSINTRKWSGFCVVFARELRRERESLSGDAPAGNTALLCVEEEAVMTHTCVVTTYAD